MDENELIRLMRNNDEEAVNIIIRHYSALICKLVGSIIGQNGTREDIEDCMSETFFYVSQNINIYDEARGSFKNWLCVVAKSRAINYIKKMKHNDEMKDRYIVLEGNKEYTDYFKEVILKEDLNTVMKYIDLLKEPQRRIIIMSLIYEMTPKEIAIATKIPLLKINYYLYETRKKIRKSLREEVSYGEV